VVWRPPPGKRGAFLHARLVEVGGRGVRVRRLGGDRAGEVRVTRFLRNPSVTIEEIVSHARLRTSARVGGRHVLAIQDTTDVRVHSDNSGMVLHPTIAVDADDGALLGLVHAELLKREGGRGGGRHKKLPFDDKQSRRWLRGIEQAATLRASGAAAITVIADREGDIYEDFALRSPDVDLVIRAGQNRCLSDGSHLFDQSNLLPQAGEMLVDLPAAPGRSARTAKLSLRFATVEIARPKRQVRTAEFAALPDSITLNLVEACELDPPAGAVQAHWRLLTTHPVANVEDARRIVQYYRQRWTIEQVFRTLKTKGFDVEALRIAEGPFEKLIAAALVAAVTVFQLVRERDGAAKRPLTDVLDPADRPALEAINTKLEGKTLRQKNPHPKGSLAYAAWVFARLGGWTGYYGKPGPVVMLSGLIHFQALLQGWKLHDV